MIESFISKWCTIVFCLFSFALMSFAGKNTVLKFDFGDGNVKNGFVQVKGNMAYTRERGYGFISSVPVEDIVRDHGNEITSDFCTSKVPFYFVVDLPEGFYQVRMILGDVCGKSKTTVKAESRRLMLEEVKTDSGEVITKIINVNVRTPKINDEKSIRLKPREINYLNWDNKLTLEFNNEAPCICALEISRQDDLTTVFLAGNSTVVDQEYEPWCSWGQMITRFFDDNIVVANYAESGEALKSFQAAGRFEKILRVMKPGDYLFIEFGHNDQKPQSSSYVKPFEGYKEELKKMITQTKEKGGVPVLVSSMHRRSFNENGRIVNTHGDYPEAVKQTAIEEDVAFINLNEMSWYLYEALGVDGSKKAFVHYPANSFPGQEKELADNSHFSPYGAYQIAKCILKGIQESNLELKNFISEEFKSYDPGHPDPFESWNLPSSPYFESLKPDGY